MHVSNRGGAGGHADDEYEGSGAGVDMVARHSCTTGIAHGNVIAELFRRTTSCIHANWFWCSTICNKPGHG
jgi:hypothetical protein